MSLLQHLRTLPDDWESWLVFADQLTERGDPRGEMLVLDHRGERERVVGLVDQWMADHPFFGDGTNDSYRWLRRLEPLADPRAPAVFSRPLSQLVALIDLERADGVSVPPAFVLHREHAFAAALAWLDRAFDAELPSLGRWQDRSDSLEYELSAVYQPATPEHTLYHVPAALAAAVRAKASGVQRSINLDAALYAFLVAQPGNFRAMQHHLCAPLERRHRAAIYGCALLTEYNSEGDQPWARVWNAEREDERADWFELFVQS